VRLTGRVGRKQDRAAQEIFSMSLADWLAKSRIGWL
jgi:hypothetical protein